MGSYLSQDPIRLLGGFGLYLYVDNVNNEYDILGLDSGVLRRVLGGIRGDNKQAQHLIPEEIWNDVDNTKFFNEIGLGDGRDAASNGLLMWNSEARATTNGKAFYHSSNHPDYSLKVGYEVRDIKMSYRIHGDPDIARKEISQLQEKLRTELNANCKLKAERLH